MTPAELGLPEAPWYGAREADDDEWTILETLDDAISMYEETSSNWYMNSVGDSHRFEVAAFRDANDEEKADPDYCVEDNGCRLIGDVITVVAEVTLRKVEE